MQQLKISYSITRRDSAAIEKYLTEISKIPLLSPEEESELARKIKLGEESALEELVRCNLRFVVSVAKQYQSNGLTLSDLINEGNLGLIKAARRFDETKGFKFISYAVWWIRQSILHAIIDYSKIVRIPMQKMASYHKLNEAYMELFQSLEREPTEQEIAEKLNLSLKDVDKFLKASINHLSFDAPIGEEDDGYSLLDVMVHDEEFQPDRKLMEESISEDIQNGLSVLSPREFEIISMFYGLFEFEVHSIEEISQKMGISKERIRQIKEKSIRRVKRGYRNSVMRRNNK